jgi:hypothetical protein
VVEVGAPGKVVTVVSIDVLHVPGAASLIEDALVVLTLNHDAVGTVQTVVNIQSSLWVIQSAYMAVWAGLVLGAGL